MAEQDKWVIEDDRSEENRRQYERYSTDFFLRVYDQQDCPLGQIIDISLGGMRLLGTEPLASGDMKRLWMEISLESGLQERIELDARVAWRGADDNSPDLYNTGFQFIDPSPEVIDTIKNIIAELSA